MTWPLPWESADKVRIGRLRVRGETESKNLRLSLGSMLDRVDLRPQGVPPSAVLIVRRMSDPMPGRLEAHARMAVDGTWARAARDRLTTLYRSAVNPRTGLGAEDADAVVFPDEAALLASLARDVVDGRLGERWWWGSVVSRLPYGSESVLARMLRDRAVAVPAAFALLAREGAAVTVVRALRPREALEVLSAVAAVHGTSDLLSGLESDRGSDPPSRSAGLDTGSQNSYPTGGGENAEARLLRERRPAMSSIPPPAPPWSNWVSVPEDLDRAQACLLGTSLVLYQRPEVPRSAAFAVSLRRWWRSERVLPPPAPPAQGSRRISAEAPCAPEASSTGLSGTDLTSGEQLNSFGPRLTDDHAKRDVLGPLPTSSADDADIHGGPLSKSLAEGQQSPRTRLETSDTGSGDDSVLGLDRSTSTALPTRQSGSLRSAEQLVVAMPQPSPGELIQRPSEDARDRADSTNEGRDSQLELPCARRPTTTQDNSAQRFGLMLEGGVDTALGGVLFLINLMCSLDLPRSFEEGWQLESRYGAWGVLDALARGLLASYPNAAGQVDATGHAPVANDPVWQALTLLSGPRATAREAVAASYRVPDAWLSQLPASDHTPVAWAARRGLFRIWSEPMAGAGYVLHETALGETDSAFEAIREARRYGIDGSLARASFSAAPVRHLTSPLTAGLDPTLKRWLSLVIPFVRLRLARALQVDVDSLCRTLLVRNGRLFVTSTHVDLVMRIDSVTLPVRMAGLDRNPGWLSELGRVVLFHFE
jgi:hypothetical protein